MKKIIRGCFDKFLDFMDAPPRCLFCREESDDREAPFCSACLSEFSVLLEALCPDCNERSEDCRCAPTPAAARTYHLLWYGDEKLQKAVYILKRNGGRCDFRFFASLLEKQIKKLTGDALPFECVTFVPRSPNARREYGYDQAKQLALELAKRLSLPCLCLIKHTGVKGEQKRLSREFRGHAVKTKYKTNKRQLTNGKLPYRQVLLVDDIATTGATLGECARLLKDAGVRTVFTAVIARTPLIS